jgi:hypothetical protein
MNLTLLIKLSPFEIEKYIQSCAGGAYNGIKFRWFND